MTEASADPLADTARMLAARFPAPRWSQWAAEPAQALDAG